MEIPIIIHRAECFGLLGVNGAGKTTTFRMIIGDTTITYGQAYAKGLSLKTELNKNYQDIGYCPQFDALQLELTGKQILVMFCLLRGVPKDRITNTCQELANIFDFRKHLYKQVKAYSGGNRRKLSVAIATIGNPSIIYLDEPTTGVDPASKRHLWDMMAKIRDNGTAIVLSSHSMEEVEALCTRLAIMANGQIKCIGSIQHIKNKYSKGLVLKIKIDEHQK